MREPEARALTDAARHTKEFRLHPLGFFYLKNDIGQGTARRVHVWLPDSIDLRENYLHLHSFDIDSFVVFGKMRSELFRFREAADGRILEFGVSYKAGKSILRRTGKRGELDAIGSFETASGERYHLRAGVIHGATVNATPCVTVLTTTERGIPIYSYGLADEGRPFVRRVAKREEAYGIAAALEDALHF